MKYTDLKVPLLVLVLCLPCLAREWVNDEGRKIEADYDSCDGSTVVLMRAGKEIRYPLARLSPADQVFIKQQQEQAAGTENGAGETPGKWIRDFAIKPAFPDTKSYLKHRNTKAVYEAFDKGGFPPDWTVNKKDAAAEFAYDFAKASAYVYLPAGRKGGKPPGVSRASKLEEILQQALAILREDGFRVELHAVDRVFLVHQAHDLAFLGPCGDFEAIRQGLALDDERVVARGLEGTRHAGENTLAGVMDG